MNTRAQNDAGKLASYWEWMLIVFSVVFYVLVFPHGIHGDGRIRYDGLLALLHDGTLKPILYSYVGPLVSSPLLLLGYVIKSGDWWISRFNTFLIFGTVCFFWRGLRQEFSSAELRRMVLLFFCATMFPKHSTDYYSEVFSACTMAAAIFLFSRASFFAPMLLLLLSGWNNPGTAVGASLVLCYFCWRERRLRFLAGVPLLFLGIMLENYLKFGAPFPADYLAATGPKNILPYSGGPGFNYPLFFGVLSVVFSFGKGLIFFIPGLALLASRSLWAKSKLSDFFRASSLYLGGLILVFSRWWCWTGDWFWGPRFYLFASILAVLAFVQFERVRSEAMRGKLVAFMALAFSLWVGCQGVTWGQDFLEDCYRNDSAQYYFVCHYVPEYSSLWRPFVVWPAIRGKHLAFVIYFALVAVTLLWRPGKELLRDCLSFARSAWQAKLREGAWKI